MSTHLGNTQDEPDATSISALFRLGKHDTPVPWNDDDRGAILRHQLDQRLGPAPDGDDDGWAKRTHLALFNEDNPPSERLQQVKDRAKAGVNHELHLPRDVATIVYYAALAAARLRSDTPITRLDDAAFAEGLRWSLDRTWLSQPLRPLLTEALDAVNAGPA